MLDAINGANHMDRLTFKHIVILGATGPTGFHLVQALHRDGVRLRLVSRNARKLAHLFAGLPGEQVNADMTRPDDTARAVNDCDLVFDCIGLGSSEMQQHAVTARNVAAALRSTGARCVQVSSYWAYLPAVQLPMNESHPRAEGSAWMRERRAAEDILLEAGAAVLNLPDFFGPQVHTSVLQQALREALSGKRMNWIGGADTVHEYVYVPDAMALAAEICACAQAYGNRWIIPGAGPITGTVVARIASGILGRKVRLRTAGPLVLRAIGLFNTHARVHADGSGVHQADHLRRLQARSLAR